MFIELLSWIRVGILITKKEILKYSAIASVVSTERKFGFKHNFMQRRNSLMLEKGSYSS